MKQGGFVLRPGDVIAGKYRVIRKLGSGGEGTVYLTEHLMTDALRAIKISANDLEYRSCHELDMMKQVSHPCLPQMIDVECEMRGICLVMEYVSGDSLAEYARQKEITEDFFFSTAQQLLDALQYLHTCRLPMLHLDVKPSNIIVRADGRIVLLDMGAALPLSDVRRGQESCYGTPGYAAPEQFSCEEPLTVRTDLYGFGATMFYLLYGRKYDPSADASVSGAPLQRWKRRVRRILLDCLQQDQRRRPASAVEVKRRFQRLQFLETHRRTCLQYLAVLGLLGGVVLFAQSALGSWQDEADRLEQYQSLLEAAERSGTELAFENYQAAAQLCPERMEVFQSCIDRILSDLTFSVEEESGLQNLLGLKPAFWSQTMYEELQEQGEVFGEFSYHLGMAYWYFYEGSGGRAAASAWFSRAQECADAYGAEASWVKEAAIYARIGAYYEKLGRQELPGVEPVSPAVYWSDLEELSDLVVWDAAVIEEGKEETDLEIQTDQEESESDNDHDEEGYDAESENQSEEWDMTASANDVVRRSLMEEQLNLLIFDSADLKQAGYQEKGLLARIQEIEQQGAEWMFPGRCEEAAAAVHRAYGSK
jgi:serine/threonine-protein kinase